MKYQRLILISIFAIAINTLLISLTHPGGIQPRTDSLDPTPNTSKIAPPTTPDHATTSTNSSQQDSKTTHLLRFESETAKHTFLDVNNLRDTDLTPAPKLNAFTVKASHLKLSTGVQSFVNQPYRALLTPNDPLFTSQWHFTNTNTQSAWNHQVGNANVTVAVIDTGFGLNVADLETNWARNSEEIGSTNTEGPAPNCSSRNLPLDKGCNNHDDDNDGYIDNHLGWNFNLDNNNVSTGQTTSNAPGVSHGTTVASLIGARANNATGGSGISQKSKILPIQVLDDYGSGDTLSVALGIRYAVDHGAKIVNLSLGAEADDPIVSEQIDYADENGVIVVAASGNDGCNCISYPARYPSVIAVGATTSANSLASFSSYGPNLDLVAPGVNICSTIWTSSSPAGTSACSLNGTSFSSPIVAGAIALLLAQNPTLSPTQITTAVNGTTIKLPAMGGANFTNLYGYGLLNVHSSLSDVSITSPVGSPLSASFILRSELTQQLTGYEYDKYNSTCTTTLPDTTCVVRAINPQTNEVITVTQSATPNSIRNLQADLLTANLPVGNWLLQSYLITSTGIQSMVNEKQISIKN